MQVLRLFGIAIVVTLTAAAITALLVLLLGHPRPGPFHFPATFAVSTLLLGAGSYSMQRALQFVKWERQRPFRLWLLRTLVIGTTFIGVQSYALWCVVPAERSATEASAGVAPFVLALGALHACHFLIAVFVLSFVTNNAFVERYDHEYHWGVTVCTYFWHGLGIVWLVILAIFVIAIV